MEHIIRSKSITGGTIDNTPIGQTTPAAGAFTVLKSDDPVDAHGIGDRAYNDIRYTISLPSTTVADPALNAATSTAIIDSYGGVVITLTGAGNAQTLQDPTDLATIRKFMVVADDGNGANTITVNGIVMSAGEAYLFAWDGSAWMVISAVDAGDITFTPAGTIVATNVQLAIEELDNDSRMSDSRDPNAHTASHTDGTDDLQSATNAQKGVATAAQITALELATALLNYGLSPMIVTGGELTNGTNAGTFKVAALTCLLRSTDSVTGSLVYLTLAEQDNQTITAANTTYFVSLNYNDGVTPTISLSATQPYGSGAADYRNISIGKIMKNGGNDVHYHSGGFRFQDGVRKLHSRAGSLRKHELASGATIAYSGTNNFTMAEGKAQAGINSFTLDAYNSASTQFTAVYDDGGSGWTEADSNVIDFAHYDDGDGTLGEVGNAKYSTFYVWQHYGDSHVYVQYGTGSYSLAAAEAAPIPTAPTHFTDFGVFIGKIVAPQAGGSFSLIQMETDTKFSAANAADHGSLTGLLDDDHTQYLLRAVNLAVKLAADHTWIGPTQTITAGENLAIFETAYLKSDGKYWKTDANTEATAANKIVMATAAIAADASGVGLIPSPLSFIRDDSTAEWTFTNIGAPLYLSTTGGELLEDASGYASPDILRVGGYMETATVLNFDASKTFVKAS